MHTRVGVALLLAVVAGSGCYKADDPSVVPGIVVSPVSGLVTTEAGGTAAFTVVLTAAPAADVTIGLTSSNTDEGTVSAATLTFTALNWNIPQTVTVSGGDDPLPVADGNVAYTIVIAAATSADAVYNGMDPSDVAVVNNDDDAAGITVTPTSGLFTSEGGGIATFTVQLDSVPTADVTIGLASSNTAEGTVAPISLTFLGNDASALTPQTVTVTGVDDATQDGPQAYSIVTAAAVSTDSVYGGLNASDVSVTNNDNDTPGITLSNTSLTTTEAGGTATFTVVLNMAPTDDVAIGLSSSNTDEGTVSPASLTFTTANWDQPQTVTVTGVDDDPPVVDGDAAYTIVTAAASSADANYGGLNAADVSVTNTDDDTAAVVVTADPGLETTEAGGTCTFTVALSTVPSATVTVDLSSSDTGEGTVAPSQLTFLADATALDAQTVTVTGVDDSVIDGNISFTIVIAPAVSGDTNYNNHDATDVSVTNLDDDAPAIVVDPDSGLITTEGGGTATFTVRLASIPTDTVTIGLSSSDSTEGSVDPTSLVFQADATALDPQTVTVTGADDGIADGNIAYQILTAAAVSADADYSGLNAADVSVTNTDNEGVPVWTKSASNPVLTRGTGTWDNLYVIEPAVIKMSDTSYVMWFEGRNSTGAKSEQIGRATSSDGVAWTKDAAPVFSPSGVKKSFDENGVACPSVWFDGGTDYRLWFSGSQALNKATDKVGLAASTDGITWTRDLSNPVLVGGAAGSWEATEVGTPFVLGDGTNYRVWYGGRDAGGVYRLGTATSSDGGVTWVKSASNPVLSPGAAGEFDAGGVRSCSVVQTGPSTYRMWYTGAGAGGVLSIGYATSTDGVSWVKFPSNPVMVAGAAGSWDAGGVGAPWVIKDGSTLKMWYVGQNAAGVRQIGYATSPDP
jgi:predicted GH43/DUF377 family glycosyl hydrolase